jgi:hypothetical protein
MSLELIKKAFDGNAWVYADNEYGQAVAPAMYDEMIRDYQSKNLVIAPLAEQFDFTQPGRSLTVTIDVAPTAAALTAETDAAAVSAITNRQVTFIPKEYTKKFEASYWEMERGFLPFMQNATKKLGYSLALQKDSLARDALYNGCGHEIYSNNKVAPSDISSTDTFNLGAIVSARKLISKSLYNPTTLVIGKDQEADLLGITNIYKANEFGTRSAIEGGLIGNLLGFDIFTSDAIVAGTTGTYDGVVRAIALGKTGSGESAFGHAFTRLPIVESDKDISFRQVIVVASEAYDFKVLHEDAICVIGSYA